MALLSSWACIVIKEKRSLEREGTRRKKDKYQEEKRAIPHMILFWDQNLLKGQGNLGHLPLNPSHLRPSMSKFWIRHYGVHSRGSCDPVECNVEATSNVHSQKGGYDNAMQKAVWGREGYYRNG